MGAPLPQKVKSTQSWGGKFIELTQGAFNQHDVPGETDPLSQFLDKVSNMTPGKLIDSVFGATAEDIGNWKEQFGEYMAKGAKLITRTGLTEVGAIYGGPTGLAAAELASSVADEAIDSFLKIDKDHVYTHGDWILIDLGKKKKDSKKLKQQMMWMETAEFGVFDMTLHKDETREDYSVGFYVNRSTLVNESMVFCFERKKVVSARNDHIRPMTTSQKAKFDGSFEYSIVREIFLEKEANPHLIENISTVPCESGTEVIYKDKVYHIGACTGLSSVIEDVNGDRLKVDMESLQRGRTLTNTMYNYTQGELDGEHTPSGFHSNDALVSGDYCWLPATSKNTETVPHCEVVLCVISYFQGHNVICYEAFNGTERIIGSRFIQVPTGDVRQFISSFPEFQKFRLEAAESSNHLPNYSVGSRYTLMCHGIIEGFGVISYSHGTKAEQGMNQTPGETLSGKGYMSSQVLPSMNPRVNAKAPLVMEEDEEQAEKTGSTIYMVLGGIAVVGLIYFVARD